ncbi:MAG: hypothetical protein A4E32_01360 [Methanomassiliicoccales archaeon PtaU1.Bin124]|nr:MAG: hypothetical protein A4E32_01360 [Methanomassiliicoccales archaeon PtaU1.Bin124]
MSTKETVANVTIMVEGYPRVGFKAFSNMLVDGSAGVCISRLHPDYVAEKYDLKGPKFYWLTGNRSDVAISPKSLSPMLKAIKQDSRDTRLLVFLDGLEYLLLWNDMKKVLAAMIELGTMLDRNGGELFISIDPLTLEQVDLDRIYAAFPRVMAMETVKEQAQQIASTSPGGAAPVGAGLAVSKVSTASP